MGFKKIVKEEDGAIAVMVALLMVVLLGFTALTVDYGLKYVQEARIQTACDAAALAAGSALPDTCKATELAKYYVKENGFDEKKAKITFSDSDTKVTVELENEVKTTFAAVLGVKNMQVSKMAQAGYDEEVAPSPGSGSDGGFPYALFSGSTTAELKLGGVQIIHGNVHSNGSLNVNTGGATASSFTSSGNIYVNTGNTKIGYYDNDGKWVEVDLKNKDNYDKYVKKNTPVETMPTYLGDNMTDMIEEGKPKMPTSWQTTADFNTGASDWWGTAPTKVGGTLSSGKSVHLYIKSGGGGYAHFAVSSSNDIWMDREATKNVAFELQIAVTSTINGNLYITNTKENTALTGTGGKLTINGDIYCEGKLELGSNVTVNGNIYVLGNFKTSGGGNAIKGNIYANEVFIGNNVSVDGAVVAEGNITFNGGTTSAKSDKSTLSIYSKNGNITFGAANTEVHGIIFAPNGNIDLLAQLKIYGNIIGNTILRADPAKLEIYPPDGRDLGFSLEDPEADSSSGSKGSSIRLLK